MKEMAFVSFRGMKEGGLGFGCYQEAVLNYKIYSKIWEFLIIKIELKSMNFREYS